jgi:hypothetical protein
MVEQRLSPLPAALWLVPAAALIVALAPLPYGYYTLLRIVVCGAGAFIAYKSYETNGKPSLGTGVMIGVALLFNPLIPIHLSREIWAPIDVGTALVFLLHWRASRR